MCERKETKWTNESKKIRETLARQEKYCEKERMETEIGMQLASYIHLTSYI